MIQQQDLFAVLDVAAATPRAHKAALGQFMTPPSVARFMAGLLDARGAVMRLLDAGAGLGSLASAVLERWARGDFDRCSIAVTAHELDERLTRPLKAALEVVAQHDGATVEVRGGDYLAAAALDVAAGRRRFTHAILNPPYKKIATASQARLACRRFGLETVNLYSAFVGAALAQLAPGGQLVAIVPRSFCNGPYYRPFREFVFARAAVQHIHLFESRDQAFRADAVLQENVIILLERDAEQGAVTITASTDDRFADLTERQVAFEAVVKPDDAEKLIHIPATEERDPLDGAPALDHRLEDLDIDVSTGPVVDFRLRDHLRANPGAGSVPLLYPAHLAGREAKWPIVGMKKPNAIARNEATERWLLPGGTYVVVRRFSSKEERRRIVASIVAPSALGGASAIGFENHLNVFHENKAGLPRELALGLFVYLNSTAVDTHFRRFNGHTQVNATDLRSLRYPSRQRLMDLGEWCASHPEAGHDAFDVQVGILLA